MGEFALRDPSRPILFVATGTGVAPMMPMLRRLSAAGRAGAVKLWFGCRDRAAADLLDCVRAAARPAALDVVLCVSREKKCDPASEFAGRVTDALAAATIDWSGVDVYVVGNPNMVRDVVALAGERGGVRVYTEHF